MTNTIDPKASASLLGCLASHQPLCITQVARATGLHVWEVAQAALELRERYAAARGVAAEQVDLPAVARSLVGRA